MSNKPSPIKDVLVPATQVPVFTSTWGRVVELGDNFRRTADHLWRDNLRIYERLTACERLLKGSFNAKDVGQSFINLLTQERILRREDAEAFVKDLNVLREEIDKLLPKGEAQTLRLVRDTLQSQLNWLKEQLMDQTDKTVVNFEDAKARLGSDSNGSGNNWLSKLEEGCVFYAKDNNPRSDTRYLAHRFYLCSKLDTNLFIMYYGQNDENEIGVIPEDFSTRFTWLYTVEQRDSDDERNRFEQFETREESELAPDAGLKRTT